jgi:iron complex outermembrane receptor protein
MQSTRSVSFRASVTPFVITFGQAFGQVLLGLAVLSHSSAHAENQSEVAIPEITVLGVTGDQRSSVHEFLPTVSEVSGRKLDKKRQSTLGETLARETGVSSTQYGPNASRPVIRGLEGERVRILQGGIGTLDASATSVDHAIAMDPLLIDRVEIIRGSAALLYGSSAIGGVVNTTSSRIPTRLNYDSKIRLDSRFSSVDQGRSLGLLVNSSSGRWAYHLDSIVRGSENYQTPLRTVTNSQSQSFEGALGLSQIGERGYFGASFSNFNTDYGVVKSEDVTIDLTRSRMDFAGEFKSDGWIESGRVAGAVSYYKHTEMEGSAVGTTFRNRGAEARADLKHRAVRLGRVPMQGVLGVQAQLFGFTAVGREAFLPSTLNSQGAVFAYEEIQAGDFTPTFGARAELSRVTKESSMSRDFVAPSLAAGTLYRLTDTVWLGVNTTFTERSPNYQELFADGPHIATGSFEKGDAALRPEIGKSLEFSVRRKTESGQGRATVFVQDFTRFIALIPNGELDPDDSLPEFEFRSVSAVLYGAELEHTQRLPWTLWDGAWELEARLDLVRGRDRTNETHLPRITPVRETVGLAFRGNSWGAEIEIARSEAQGFVAPNETPTSAYTMINVGADFPFTTGFGAARITAKLQNALNVDGRNHVSFVKDLAPLAGRNVVVGVQARL